ncbi:hypothetical protein [Polaromonas sp. A23]|uniref:DUF6929 family protein n=1 Tax=Polaromonas sp. A23 TaxID=1944133 RepID=UPI0009846709|nr:hypothetical protein [Polaromonas sp. A23]OOG43055.1 hypothetical protein B0B52_10470 [Polaromonas sp. A23]
MLIPLHLRDLLLEPAAHPRGQAHLSAASGMVQAGPWLYVVADDEHHLGRFAASGEFATPVHLHRLVPGDLPDDKDKRKKRKPDFEALALLPAMAGQPHGALLAVGSGSKPNRQQALVLPLDAEGGLHGAARVVDLAGMYQPLAADFPMLNIEGAFVAGERFCLLQRGNKGDARNACVEFPLHAMLGWLAGHQSAPPEASRILHLELGDVDGIPLGFTDGAALPGGGWIFSAVAEDTRDSYTDGRCGGSAIGWVSADGKLQRVQAVSGAPKIEGIALAGNGQLLMVTDSDDPAVASQLLAVALA